MLVILSLAVYRVTRLIVFDTLPLVARPVAWLQRQVWNRFGEDWAHGFDCVWCVSIWVGGLLTLVVSTTIELPVPWLVWPATSVVAGFLGYLDQVGATRTGAGDAG